MRTTTAEPKGYFFMTYLGIKLEISKTPLIKKSILFQNEFWKPVPDYEKYYLVSTLGRIRRISQKGTKRNPPVIFKFKTRFQKRTINKNGYMVISLCKDSYPKLCYVHRIMALAFFEFPNYKADVNHKNMCRSFNWISNLEVVSHRCNSSHCFKKMGCFSSSYTGVSYITKRKKWKAGLQINGKNKTIGQYNTEIEAAKAYKDFISENNIVNSYL